MANNSGTTQPQVQTGRLLPCVAYCAPVWTTPAARDGLVLESGKFSDTLTAIYDLHRTNGARGTSAAGGGEWRPLHVRHSPEVNATTLGFASGARIAVSVAATLDGPESAGIRAAWTNAAVSPLQLDWAVTGATEDGWATPLRFDPFPRQCKLLANALNKAVDAYKHHRDGNKAERVAAAYTTIATFLDKPDDSIIRHEPDDAERRAPPASVVSSRATARRIGCWALAEMYDDPARVRHVPREGCAGTKPPTPVTFTRLGLAGIISASSGSVGRGGSSVPGNASETIGFSSQVTPIVANTDGIEGAINAACTEGLPAYTTVMPDLPTMEEARAWEREQHNANSSRYGGPIPWSIVTLRQYYARHFRVAALVGSLHPARDFVYNADARAAFAGSTKFRDEAHARLSYLAAFECLVDDRGKNVPDAAIEKCCVVIAMHTRLKALVSAHNQMLTTPVVSSYFVKTSYNPVLAALARMTTLESAPKPARMPSLKLHTTHPGVAFSDCDYWIDKDAWSGLEALGVYGMASAITNDRIKRRIEEKMKALLSKNNDAHAAAAFRATLAAFVHSSAVTAPTARNWESSRLE